MDALDPYDLGYLRKLLERSKRMAMVGASPNASRPSWMVARYMKTRGYEVLPVNPRGNGQTLAGMPFFPSLAEIPATFDPIDMVVVFRKSEDAGAVVDDAIASLADRGLQTIWMQIGVRDEAAAERAKAAGLDVVMNRCPKMELSRFNGELSFGGINTGVISSKLPRL